MPTTLTGPGDAIRGDRVAISARRLSRPRLINLTGRHKAQEITAWDNVYCVIEVLLRALPKALQEE